jgi:hypothetical protein
MDAERQGRVRVPTQSMGTRAVAEDGEGGVPIQRAGTRVRGRFEGIMSLNCIIDAERQGRVRVPTQSMGTRAVAEVVEGGVPTQSMGTSAPVEVVEGGVPTQSMGTSAPVEVVEGGVPTQRAPPLGRS